MTGTLHRPDLGITPVGAHSGPAGELIGSVHSWDVVTAADGPGTRFVTFFAGCHLRCLYCHNPDTWEGRNGQHITVDDLVAKMTSFKPFIKAAGGGVTVSGGEPLLQHHFVEAYLRRCKQEGMHTALDTAGFLGARATDQLLDDTDLVLLDVKSSDANTYRKVTGVALHPTIAFGDRLAARGNRMRVRFVLVPGLTDDPANIAGVADLAARWGSVDRGGVVEQVDILGYHRLGVVKYQELGMRYPLPDTVPPDAGQLAAAAAHFAERGLRVTTS
ncbi:pyruvate formate-lyase-activating protein [Actinoplanes teichomyceticus]|uniref:Pyruvate formate-lyase-activating enzyme n=1 Tax=Actinoplanes teichomyceticus TaxID=1867 RepID=A0A561VCN5_ACTTI|nr:pyruvate formate-lyase-activating protein [Actinoplanes teichomyceticus]TWG09363.1 pyruvate formate lyase activating enzyme [Actinoplanes teichomyceticus]GIF17221.1 pyruvate formate-lyase-activating enzyme [Actinoplanes teichomyceticus]